jgi:hypothetical protein
VRFKVEYAQSAFDDLDRVDPFDLAIIKRAIQGLGFQDGPHPEGKMEGAIEHGRDGAMRRTYSQAQVDAKSRELIALKLTRLIRSYEGSAREAKEIVRGLAAARMMDMDCRPFEDALARRFRSRKAA